MGKTIFKNFQFGPAPISLCIPDKHILFLQYKQQFPQQLFPPEGEKSNFPFWAKVWPSAIALSEFIKEHQELVANKKVLELAAGLGLPGLVASQFASKCILSDYNADALNYMDASILKNNFKNCTTKLIDWNHLNETDGYDILLMSDVNYEPEAFAALERLFLYFLKNNVTIILASPQRLMAKPFIEKWIPYCILNMEKVIHFDDEINFVNILVIKDLK